MITSARAPKPWISMDLDGFRLVTVIARINPSFVHQSRVYRANFFQIHPLGVSGCGTAPLLKLPVRTDPYTWRETPGLGQIRGPARKTDPMLHDPPPPPAVRSGFLELGG